MPTERALLSRALEAAARLQRRHREHPCQVAYVATSYDTAFAPLEPQILGKLQALEQTWGLDGAVRWSLWLVDDLPPGQGFGRRVAALMRDDPKARAMHQEGRLHLVTLRDLPASRDGHKGRAKSVAFNHLVRALLPSLDRYEDTNAPLKVFSQTTAAYLCRNATLPRVTMDVEWLAMLHAHGCRVRLFPVVWRQRPGSRPPWHMIPTSVLDVCRVRKRWG